MTINNVTSFINHVISWLVGGGSTLLFAWFIKNRRALFNILETFADHTKTKKDNELISRLKADAETLVTAIQPYDIPGTEQKSMAAQRLQTAAKRFGKDITPQQANDYIEEAYQKNYAINSQPNVAKVVTDTADNSAEPVTTPAQEGGDTNA